MPNRINVFFSFTYLNFGFHAGPNVCIVRAIKYKRELLGICRGETRAS
jgi:hypothetical protein